jgi:hypothetical protein
MDLMQTVIDVLVEQFAKEIELTVSTGYPSERRERLNLITIRLQLLVSKARDELSRC